MLAEKLRLEKEIESIKSKLEQLPKEKLICAGNGKYYKWYRSDGHQKKYIPKKNKQLAEKLAERKYLSYLLEDYISETKAIDMYLRHHHTEVGKAEQMLASTSEYQELLAPCFIPKSKELNNWMFAPYEKNAKNPENLIHKSSSGNVVRSKSEAIIDTLLYMHQIPFRYECALYLKGITIFPDFTIRHPKSGEIFYWEHFGLMDDLSYQKSTCAKMSTYIKNGIIPSIHLITTYETKEHPLTAEVVQKIIEHYFL